MPYIAITAEAAAAIKNRNVGFPLRNMIRIQAADATAALEYGSIRRNSRRLEGSGARTK